MPEPPRRRSLTPIGDELMRREPWLEPPRRRGPLRRLRERLRRRSAPKTFAGAIALGLLRVSLGTAAAAGVAIGLARLAGRPASTGLLIGGAACVVIALLGARSDPAAPETAPGMRQVHAMRLGWVVVGLALIALGALLDAR